MSFKAVISCSMMVNSKNVVQTYFVYV